MSGMPTAFGKGKSPPCRRAHPRFRAPPALRDPGGPGGEGQQELDPGHALDAHLGVLELVPDLIHPLLAAWPQRALRSRHALAIAVPEAPRRIR